MSARVVFCLSGLFLALTALPGVHWLDTAEFAAVGRWLSLSHAPGHPVHAVSTHALQSFFPVGDAAFRANLGSVLALAGALALLERLLARLAPGLPAWGRICAALLPVVLPAIWLQGVRAEVYALQLLLSLGIAWSLAIVHAGDRRGVLALAFAFGLAGANHSLIGLMLVPVALAVLVASRPGWRSVGLAVPAGALGLGAYAYLPLRASAGGVVGWGAPDTLSGFWEMLSARDWTKARESGGPESLIENAQRMAAWFIDHFGLISALLLFLVFVVGLLRAEKRGRFAVVGLAVAAFIANRVVVAFDPLNPDLGGYLAGALVGCIVLAALAVEQFSTRWVAAVFPLALISSATRYDPGDRQGARSAEQVAATMLAEVPADGVLVYSDYASVFSSWGMRALQGARPDVALLFRGRLDPLGWHLKRLRQDAPGWADAAKAFPAGFDGPGVRFEPGVRGEMLGALRSRLRPAGITVGVGIQGVGVVGMTRAFEPLARARDFDSVRFAAFAHAQHAQLYLDGGDGPGQRGPAAWHLSRALSLAGEDPILLGLRARLMGKPLDAERGQ